VVFERDPLPRIQFARNPLKIVVAQLRIDTDFRLEQPDVLAVIQDRLRETYPVASRVQQPQFSIQFGVRPDAEPTIRQGLEQAPVRFVTEDGGWAVTLAPDVITLETTAYEGWDPFRDRFAELLDAVLAVVSVSNARRLGIRFVNELTNPEARTIADWRRFLDPELLGTAASPRFEGRVTRAVEQLTLVNKDDAMTLRHSYTQNPEGAEPSSIYLLDIDAFSSKVFEAERDAVLSRLERFHQAAWTLFRGSLTDEMVGYLREEGTR